MFTAWRRGDLQPVHAALPDFTKPADAAIAWGQQCRAREAAEKQIALMAPKAALGDLVCQHGHNLGRFVRALPGVNTMRIKRDLFEAGYLYRKYGAYRIYAKSKRLFEERFSDAKGQLNIFPTAQGKELLARLYEAGRLTMRKGSRKSERSASLALYSSAH